MAQRLGLIVLLAYFAPAHAVDLFGDAEQEFLHPDEAFVLSVTTEDSDQVAAQFRIAEGYYLYRDKIRFVAEDAQVQLRYELPNGVIKEDPLFGRVATYSGDLAVALQVDPPPEGALMLQAHYQGCAEQGVCYPPQVKKVSLLMESGLVSETGAGGPELLSRSDRIARDLSQKTLILSFLAFLGFGLLLAFTPCVLPLIPILASVIAGASGTGRAFRLSLAYVLAMASTYAGLGVVIGLTGANLQAYMQNAWIIGGFVLILLAMALSMFGVYELRFAGPLNNRLHQLSQRFEGGNYFGAIVMGFLGALIASPCVSPPLVGALIHIAHEGGALRGGVSLFALGLGLGLPLLAFGAFEGRFLPRSGPWMTRIRNGFGVLLLALAIWMLDRIWPGQLTLVAAGLLLLFTGVYLRALDTLSANAGKTERFGKAIGVVLMVYGAIFLVGAVAGGNSVLRPLAPFVGVAQVESSALPYRAIKTTEDLQRELTQADGPVLVDFYADWCVTCQELEAFTFSDPQVQQRMRQFVLLRADVTDNDSADQALLASLGLFGPPAILFYADDGEELRSFRTVSYVPAPEFARQLDEVLEFAK